MYRHSGCFVAAIEELGKVTLDDGDKMAIELESDGDIKVGAVVYKNKKIHQSYLGRDLRQLWRLG